MNEERLSGALQENILTALCFNDAFCKMIRAAVTPQLFESSVFREIAGHAIDFIDQYGTAIKDHLPDHLESVLSGEDKRKAESYRSLLENLFSTRDSVNGEYVLSQLHKFVRQQNLKAAVVRAVEAIEDGRIDAAEIELTKGLQSGITSFEPGLNLSDPKQVASLLENPQEEGFDLGIPELDRRGIIPRRKEQTLLIAPRGRGKSWGCIHAAKYALLQGWSPVVITLENSEKNYGLRFLQSFYSMSKRQAEVRVAKLIQDRNGNLQDILHERLERLTLTDPNIKEILASKVKRDFRRRPPLTIKGFPTGQLTIDMLRAYLDGLERFQKITPDLLIVDYPDLMKHDAKNKRIELGRIFEDIRGIAGERNLAAWTVTQGNREAETATTVTGEMAAEDISKLATVDICLTYSQTLAEYKLGLARLFVEKARNEEAKQTILMSQAYAIGQFCLESSLIDAEYWDLLPEPEKDELMRGRRRAARTESDDDNGRNEDAAGRRRVASRGTSRRGAK